MVGAVCSTVFVVGSVPFSVDTCITSKKITYHFTCFGAFDVSSLSFDNNEFLQYLQGNVTLPISGLGKSNYDLPTLFKFT